MTSKIKKYAKYLYKNQIKRSKEGFKMKKTYFVFILLIALAFITACSGDKETPPPAAGIEDEPAPPAEPEAPPITVAPENPADKTTFLAPLPNVNNAVIDRATNTVSVDFRNDLELPITLPLTGSWAKYSETECINPQINAIYKGEICSSSGY
jgi:hypothetical protein